MFWFVSDKFRSYANFLNKVSMSDRPIRTRSQYKLGKKLQEKLTDGSLSKAEMIEGTTGQQSPITSQIDLTNTTVIKNDSYLNSGPAIFSNEQPAIAERENCDYSIRISLDMAKNGNLPRKIRILAHGKWKIDFDAFDHWFFLGVYDLFHVGHAHQLMQAKNMFSNTYLIVGVFNDQVTLNERGQTVLNELERYECVRHCRYVDEIIPNLPSMIDDAFLTEHKIDFIAQPAPLHEFDKTIDIFRHVKVNIRRKRQSFDREIELVNDLVHKESIRIQKLNRTSIVSEVHSWSHETNLKSRN